MRDAAHRPPIDLLPALGIHRSGAKLYAVVSRLFLHLAGCWRGRRAVMTLAGSDSDRLRDIGIAREYVRLALQAPLWIDPSTALAKLAKQRRHPRRDAMESYKAVPSPQLASLCSNKTQPNEPRGTP
jgi:uncharacterized protein YjiS (DUF1127 family)